MAKPNEELLHFDTRWFAGLTSKEVEEMKTILLSDKKVLDILSKILYNMSTKEEKVTSVDYDSPSWSHKQAHKNGYREAILSIARMVNLDGQK